MYNKKIYMVAPSFGVTIEPYLTRLNKSIANFKNLGYEITIGNNVFKNKGIVSSNSPKLRGKEINEAYKSDSSIIISVGGGELMIEMLEYIDFKLIEKNKDNKIYIGFSDNTNLTYTITTLLDIPSIYGRNATAYGIYPFQYDSKDTIDLINGKKVFNGYKKFQLIDLDESPIHKYKFDNETNVISYNYNKPIEGIFIGGCLDCLVSLCGTKFDNTVNYINKHKNDGIIFFMEACDLNSISLRRALIQLKYAGWFDNVSAFLIGRSLQYNDESFGLPIINSYIDILKPFNKPLLLNAPIGHISPTLPIKLGVKAKLTYKDNNIKIEYK